LEIQRYLEHGQTPDTRPDLIAIVFKLKLDAFLHDAKERHIFGLCIGSSYTIEYQKSGLPHAHVLLFMHEDFIPRCGEQVDELVRAQIPIDDPELAEIVKTHMVHGPCGPNYRNSPCFRDGKCSKGYPKRWCENTILSENSYPEYARPNNGVTWERNGFTIDTRWVGVHAIKYMAKYVYKGSDRATLEVQNQYDEIAMTVQGRYISPVQAVWRLLGYATHEEKPAVMLLPYHLEGQYRVSFDQELDEVQLIAAIQ
ncbi:hypothetical protein EPUL_006377, partial [Erysiphe pulchra]